MAKKNQTGTKADAIRTAITALGGPDSAKTADVVAKIKDEGFKASGNEVSMYKTKMRKTGGASMPTAQTGKMGIKRKPSQDGAFSGDAIKAVKGMIDKYGAEKVKALADLLG